MSYTHKKKPPDKAEDREQRTKQAKRLLAEAEEIEVDGVRVVKLPEQKPPRGRSLRTRFHYGDVGKGGSG